MNVDISQIDSLRTEFNSFVQDGTSFFNSAKKAVDQRKSTIGGSLPPSESSATNNKFYDDWDFLDEEHKTISSTLVRKLTELAPRLMQAVQLSPLLRDEERDIRLLMRGMTTSLQLRYLRSMPAEMLNMGKVREEHRIETETAAKFFLQESNALIEKLNLLSPTPETLASAIVASQTLNIQKYRPNTAFIMMQINSKVAKFEDVNNAIKEVFKEFGIEALRADEIEHSDSITNRILDEIATSEFSIADLTGARPSVYYEVGYAHALGKRPILYREEGTQLHFDLSVNNVPEYRNITNLKAQLRKRLEAMTNKKGLRK